MSRRKRKRLKGLEIAEVSLVERPAIRAARFLIAKEQGEHLTPEQLATLDAIIATHAPRATQKRAPREPAPDVPSHELARVRAFMGGR